MYIRQKLLIVGIAGLLTCCGFGIGLGLYYANQEQKPPRGAIVTNGHECASIGGSILKKGGSAVDAAIAALFCEGIAMPQSMGLGGGFFMIIYIKENRTVDTLDARETAPAKAHLNMYHGNASLSLKGGLSVAIPAELQGYWYAHQKYGKLPWKTLIEPTIKLCKKGHLVTPFLSKMFKKQRNSLLTSPTLRKIYVDPTTNEPYKTGHYVKRLRLAKTLQLVAEHGPDVLYNGELTKPFLKDIADHNGIITEEDMKNYKPLWLDPVNATLSEDHTLYTTPLPSSGIILAFILNILNNFLDNGDLNTVKNWQRIVESFKFGYGRRTELGDAAFVPGLHELVRNLSSPAYAAGIKRQISDNKTYQDPEHYGGNFAMVEDHGTAHISILAPNGDAVSVTSTINLYFGAGFASSSTGIILNDEMDDFSAPNITNDNDIPPSPANYIAPNKRPLSSMCPSLVVDKNGNVSLIIGGAGGSKITTSVALVALRNLLFNEDLRSAMDAKRLHHQLFPMEISHELNFNQDILDGLRRIGHKIEDTFINDGFSALTAISVTNSSIEAIFDSRRGGAHHLVF